MLNVNGIRELAYVVIIDNITPIEGYDRVELAHVGGWSVVVGKGDFNIGDPAIYFEIDSKLPEVKPFSEMDFLVKKKYKIKTQKMCKSISQGLLMPAKSFGWTIGVVEFEDYDVPYIEDNNGIKHFPDGDNGSRFLTEQLGVTYAVFEDNSRKASSADKYKKMAQRHGKLFSHQPYRWLMKRDWGKKLLFLFFGRKKDKKTGWPVWVSKTDEERIENMTWILTNKDESWIATEKIDGTSTTFTMKRGGFFKKPEFYVCSRNVVFDKPDKKCFYDTNVYIEMAEKFNIENILSNLLEEFPEADWVTIQGETYGNGIQKRDYSINDHSFKAFNLIFSHCGRVNSVKMTQILSKYNISCVPILNDNYTLPDTVEELRNYVNSEKSKLDNKIKEGIVFRSQDGKRSFKCVSPEYLMTYHS